VTHVGEKKSNVTLTTVRKLKKTTAKSKENECSTSYSEENVKKTLVKVKERKIECCEMESNTHERKIMQKL